MTIFCVGSVPKSLLTGSLPENHASIARGYVIRHGMQEYIGVSVKVKTRDIRFNMYIVSSTNLSYSIQVAYERVLISL